MFFWVLSLVFLFVMDYFLFWILIELMFVVLFFMLLKEKVNVVCVIYILFCEMLASCLLIVFLLFKISFLFIVVLALKFGLFPFWFWVLRFMEEENSKLAVLVMTVYKMGVTLLCFYLGGFGMLFFSMILMNLLVVFVLFFSFHSSWLALGCLLILSSSWLILSCISSGLIIILFLHLYVVMVFYLVYFSFGNSVGSILAFCFYFGFPLFPSFFLKLLVLSCLLESYFLASMLLFVCFFLLMCFLFMRFFLFVKAGVSIAFFVLLLVFLL